MSDHLKTELEQEAVEMFGHAQEYVETRSELIRLELLDKASSTAGAAMSTLLLGTLYLFCFVFLGFALAYLIGEWTGRLYLGFISVAIMYLLAGLLFSANRKRWIEGPVSDEIIKNYFKSHEQKEH